MRRTALVLCILFAAGLAAEARRYPPAIEHHSLMRLRFYENQSWRKSAASPSRATGPRSAADSSGATRARN